MLRIFEAHFWQNVKNTDQGKNFTILIIINKEGVAEKFWKRWELFYIPLRSKPFAEKKFARLIWLCMYPGFLIFQCHIYTLHGWCFYSRYKFTCVMKILFLKGEMLWWHIFQFLSNCRQGVRRKIQEAFSGIHS